MEDSQKIATLLAERQNIEREIAKIQQLCHHSSTSIKFVRERLDSTIMVVRWTCDTCSSTLGVPNNNELQNYLKQ